MARFTPFAHETLIALADEQDEAAALVKRQRKKAWGKFTDPDGTHDYRDRDTRNLRKRGRQYSGVAQALRRMAEDPHVVRTLIEQSRDAAWGDVEANLQRRLRVEGMRPDLDPDYDRMRAARMQSITAPVQMCYAVALERNRKLSGMMVLSFRAAPDTGQFDQITIERDEVGDAQVRTCVMEAVSKLKLEKPQKTAVSVSYPIEFQPSN